MCIFTPAVERIKTINLDFESTGLLENLVLDYLQGKELVKPLYDFEPSLSGLERKIAERQHSEINRDLLTDSLLRQYENFFEKQPDRKAGIHTLIEQLKLENTFTVTTGHQLNIFTGPLFFLYKILSAISICENLSVKLPHYRFVPVYWMASEDHDFEEISSIHLFGNKVEWKEPAGGPCGRMKTKSLSGVIDHLMTLIGNSEQAEWLKYIFQKSYLENDNLAQATRSLVHLLLPNENFLVIDGDDHDLKKSFVPFMEDDLLNHTAFRLVNETGQYLRKNNFHIQVNPREVNLFYLGENSRNRLERSNDSYTVRGAGMTFSESQLMEELHKRPEAFSPNVVLRPLYQELILPNIAYAGGPGEISYWLEYNALFDHYKVSFPVLFLRGMLLWVDSHTSAQMEKLGWNESDLFKLEDVLIREYLDKTSVSISLEEERLALTRMFDLILQRTVNLDQTLASSIEGEKQKALHGIQNIETKMIRSLKKREELSLNRIKKLKQKLFPNQSFQERYDNFIPYFLKHGDNFIQILKSNINPLNKKLVVIREEEDQ